MTMENFKTRVNNKEEENIVVNAAKALGFYANDNWDVKNSVGVFFNFDNKVLSFTLDMTFYELSNVPELTPDQLQDKVILHRNDVSDATHSDGSGKALYLRDGWYFWNFNNDQWDSSKKYPHLLGRISDLKPIQKPQPQTVADMKEWLIPDDGYKYHKCVESLSGSSWIEIPTGSEAAVLLNQRLFFWKDSGNTHWTNSIWNSCEYTLSPSYMTLNEFMEEWEDAQVVWGVLPKIDKEKAKQTPKSENPTIDTTYTLLDGESARKAWANGSKIQISPIQDIPEWEDLNEKTAPLDCFQKKWLFRCKPPTIMINGTELKPWNSIQVNYENFQIKIDCIDGESAEQSYKALQKVFCNKSVNWSNN
ncbi:MULTISPECIES: hypothetical protein [unclassified Acinetobacter]|uniref:hypothetical protein n=1 Tax=unclassified Acinetobacter TaxID=196816 RepID=UPI0024490B62|nr:MULTISPECIES: hypothetical protein [unclassified Acinetobacter]MDH0032524.1 hypothetical protein [Acinetobacter sp. GD04021]MDH0885215.1 hypothetical protein [Acinetobacter sp. GD03873]MDH1084457.1 hypothetical protein [Acinetobacter sp. GD03983]MDH2188345.1 hypothetical protein [Acinetobacter sp. GD03645]MDH2203856.1 hypothetical protein [Acinetobacter sp. GD03647]